MTQRARLKWHCRRGMRELDLLLEDFLEERFDMFSVGEREIFEQLLNCRNEDLMVWLIEGGVPQDAQLASMVRRILDGKMRRT